jgi:hypothetical protein
MPAQKHNRIELKKKYFSSKKADVKSFITDI